eukprot:9321706-Pyramimonas_sp.AAC.1
MGVFACVSPTQDSASWPQRELHVLWPHRELHRRPESGCSHASPPRRTAFRGPIGSSTESPTEGVRMRLPRQGQRFVAP